MPIALVRDRSGRLRAFYNVCKHRAHGFAWSRYRRISIAVGESSPAATTQLVRQLGLSLGAVGGHLAVRRESGLVTRTRTGRSVRYERTPVGGTLAGVVE